MVASGGLSKPAGVDMRVCVCVCLRVSICWRVGVFVCACVCLREFGVLFALCVRMFANIGEDLQKIKVLAFPTTT